jgi:hypothetical protein
MKPDSDSAAADLEDAGEGEDALPSRPGCSSTTPIFAAFMRLESSVLQAEAVQRLPASGLPLWPMQITHGEAIVTCFYLLSPARYVFCVEKSHDLCGL